MKKKYHHHQSIARQKSKLVADFGLMMRPDFADGGVQVPVCLPGRFCRFCPGSREQALLGVLLFLFLSSPMVLSIRAFYQCYAI